MLRSRRKKLALLLAILLLEENEEPLRKKRSVWIREFFKRGNVNMHYDSMNNDMLFTGPEFYRAYTRMNEDSFLKLLSIVGPSIKKEDTHFRKAITTEERLSCTLRFLATGCSIPDLSIIYRFGKSTIIGIISETCKALFDTLKSKYIQVSYFFIYFSPHCLF